MDRHDEHASEARARWGETEAWKESARRTKEYTEEDWATIQGRQEAIEAGLAAALEAGEPPDGERAVELAEAARRHIDDFFYPCSPAMHVGLAEMYTADPRFRAHYEERAEGLAEYVARAIRANAAREAPTNRQ